MADKFYLANRLKYHTASRVANQTGDSLAATFNVDGHIVRDSSVWTSPLSEFPLQSNKKNADPIGATEDLVAVFKAGATSTAFWNGGLVWSNPAYPAVKLYENVTLTPVAASLGQNMNSGTPTGTAYYQAYEILASAEDGVSSGDIRVTNWVAPPAIIDPATGSPVAGYTGLQMLNGTALQKVTNCTGNDKWGLGGGHWEFVYMAGILTFEMGVTPQEIANKKTTGLTLTAFKYVGDMLSDTTETLETDIAANTADIATNTADIETINKKIESLKVAAGGNELVTGTISFETADEDGKLTPVLVVVGTSKDEENGVETQEKVEITGTIVNGLVTIVVPGEVMLVKEADGDVVSPDKDITAAGVTTVTADYGDADLPASWSITFRV